MFQNDVRLANLFPSDVRDAIIEVQACTEAPMWLVVMEFLSAMATAAQGLFDIRLPFGKRCPLSLFLLIVGESGERKGTVFGMAHAAIVAFQQYVDEYYELHANEDGAKLAWRDPFLEDATWKAILEALKGKGYAVALNTEEGDRVLSSPLIRNLGGLVSLWGGEYKVSMHRGGNERLCAYDGRLTMSLSVQPTVLADYLARNKKARGLGFWARFLVAYPLSTQGQRFGGASRQLESLPRFHKKVRAMLESRFQALQAGNTSRTELVLSPDAERLWNQIAWDIEHKLNTEYSPIRDFANKAPEITARVAGLMHCFADQQGDVSSEVLGNAWQLVQRHMVEFNKIFNPPPPLSREYQDAHAILRCLNLHGLYGLYLDDLRALTGLSAMRFRAGLFVLRQRQCITMAGRGPGRRVSSVYPTHQFSAAPIWLPPCISPAVLIDGKG